MFLCSDCNEVRESLEHLKSHISNDHLLWIPYECMYCSANNCTTRKPSINELVKHIKNCHPGKQIKSVFIHDDAQEALLRHKVEMCKKLPALEDGPAPFTVLPATPSQIDKQIKSEVLINLDDEPHDVKSAPIPTVADQISALGTESPPKHECATGHMRKRKVDEIITIDDEDDDFEPTTLTAPKSVEPTKLRAATAKHMKAPKTETNANSDKQKVRGRKSVKGYDLTEAHETEILATDYEKVKNNWKSYFPADFIEKLLEACGKRQGTIAKCRFFVHQCIKKITEWDKIPGQPRIVPPGICPDREEEMLVSMRRVAHRLGRVRSNSCATYADSEVAAKEFPWFYASVELYFDHTDNFFDRGDEARDGLWEVAKHCVKTGGIESSRLKKKGGVFRPRGRPKGSSSNKTSKSAPEKSMIHEPVS